MGPLESRLFTLKSSRTEPDQLSVVYGRQSITVENRSGPWRSGAVIATGVSRVTPSSGTENWEPVRDLVLVVKGTPEDVRIRRAQLMVTCVRIQGTLEKQNPRSSIRFDWSRNETEHS
ncbi:hypothetical protein A2U01_0023801 [Trifolium medium]|uniref:Uncharacterized protein n=1 Tax=Trifolium medium TaxID=97028 RepID=A0A392NSE7_9FABA|nr:hypothetical protein [Trifolium medium]